MAAHTGRIITYEEMLNCDHEFAPAVADMTDETPAPVRLDSDGKYPVPFFPEVKCCGMADTGAGTGDENNGHAYSWKMLVALWCSL